jgi:hypothetical protein
MRIVATVLVLGLWLSPAVAMAQAAKPRGCFTTAEQTAEQIVREGLRLREGARGCDGRPWRMGTASLWQDVDNQLGPRFLAQTNIRRKAFTREFKDDANNRLELWDGRIVMHFRHYPLSEIYCSEIKDVLGEAKTRGWAAIRAHASKSKEEVKMDYRPCPP